MTQFDDVDGYWDSGSAEAFPKSAPIAKKTCLDS